MTCHKKMAMTNYGLSRPCDHSRRWPALAATTIVKPRLNCALNFEKLTLATAHVSDRDHFWDYPTGLFLRLYALAQATTKSLIQINQHFTETAYTALIV